MTAARTLRTATSDHGPKDSSPQTVEGKVREKATTPSDASRVPRRDADRSAGAAACGSWAGVSATAIAPSAVALFCTLMQERSSVADLVKSLRLELNRYSPGEKLPSSRALVERHRVSPVTVSRALARLAAEGLVVTRPGAGAFRAQPRTDPGGAVDTSWQEVALSADAAAEVVPRAVDASGVLVTLAAPPPGVVEFNGGYLHPSLQPEQAMAAALARAGRRPGAWGRPPTDGLPELRDWFARGIGPGFTAAEVLITSGGQSALTTALRALAPPGTPVLVESPTYPGMLAIARAAGLRPVPVPAEPAHGVRPELLDAAFRATGARVFVTQPLFQNPTGAVLAPERRGEVLRIARAAGAFVVEDDFARRLVHADAGPLPATLAADDPDGVVVHVCSLTKATSPSLRVGALAARGPVLERLRAIHVVDNFFVPRPLQDAALELVGAPAWNRHLRFVAAELKARRDTMTTALRLRLPELALPHVPAGGHHLWLRLPDGTDESALVAAALRAGVAVAPGRPYFSAEPPAGHLRLSFAGVAGPAEITEGVRRLRTSCDELLGGGAG
ncbi:aminotransferase-like domain-containing protein [Streptomyces wuyuanensis]|uniref:aminotransferase-like domain-containing protein n=1 Tax=Streptomyces wuyuanensis TaxID=1196353 RepID=UPI0036740445